MQTSVEAIASRLTDMFHIEMDIFQVSENCMDALNRMHMLHLSRKAVAGHVKEQKLKMPVDCYDVKAVFRMPNSHETLTNSVTLTIQDILFPPQKIFVPIPNSDSEVQSITLPDQILNYIPHEAGPYIDFNYDDPPWLRFNEEEPDVVVIYTRIPINPDTGLCEIPEQAFNGCLNYCLYVWYQPLFLSGKVAPYIWAELKEWKRVNMAQSKNALYMSRLNNNEMSKVHNIMSSFDRKRTRLDS